MTLIRGSWIPALLGLAGCAGTALEPIPPPPPAPPPTLAEMLDCAAQPASRLSPDLRAGVPDDPYARFRLACRLGGDGGAASDAGLARALALLDGLESQLPRQGDAEVVGLYRHSLRLNQQLRVQRRQTESCQSKIEELKELELEPEPAQPFLPAIPSMPTLPEAPQ